MIDLEGQTNSLEGTWNVPDGLKNPHDLAVSDDGSTIYVVELNPFVVWKLTDGEGGVVVTPRNPGVLDRLLSFMGLG